MIDFGHDVGKLGQIYSAFGQSKLTHEGWIHRRPFNHLTVIQSNASLLVLLFTDHKQGFETKNNKRLQTILVLSSSQ